MLHLPNQSGCEDNQHEQPAEPKPLLFRRFQSSVKIIPARIAKPKTSIVCFAVRCQPTVSESRSCPFTGGTRHPKDGSNAFIEKNCRRPDRSWQVEQRERPVPGEASAAKFACHPTRQKNEAVSGELSSRDLKPKPELVSEFALGSLSSCRVNVPNTLGTDLRDPSSPNPQSGPLHPVEAACARDRLRCPLNSSVLRSDPTQH